MQCETRHDIKIIRGDSKEVLVGLARGWENVGLSPSDYEARLVIRERQDDEYAPLLEVVSELLPGTDHRFPDMDYLVKFNMSPADTESLPEYAMVCFCELRSKDGTYIRRLFNGKVKRSD